MISGHGNLTAPIMLIADGANDEDLVSGYALSGRNEKLINGFLRTHRIDVGQVYRTAFIKDRINLTKPNENRHLATDKYQKILEEEIKTVNPNIIVPLCDPNTGYQEGGERYQCLACGISGDGDELIDQPELDRVTGELALRRTIARVDEECGDGTDAAWAAMELLDSLHADALQAERRWRPGL